MAKNQTHKAFLARPTHVLDLNGELLDNAPVLAGLASEVRDISAYATYVVRNDEILGDELARVTATAPAVAGRRAGVTMPDFLATGRIVHETTLSQRVHSLWNSVRASERQVSTLRRKADRLLSQRQTRMSALDEAQLHREAASRKKRELAILATQEIAALSHLWGNAVVAVEDLSWVANTMQNGRWNRGEFVQWLAHYVSQNGGWVVAVSAANTSQRCHVCGQRVTHPTHKLSICPEHGAMDRDVNAAANIAARAVPRVVKARVTRAKNRKLQPQTALRTPPARASLKYPGRDRTKNAPTPKRKNHRRVSREVILPSCPARAQATRLEASVLADQDTHTTLGTNKAALKQGDVAYKSRSCSLIRYAGTTSLTSSSRGSSTTDVWTL